MYESDEEILNVVKNLNNYLFEKNESNTYSFLLVTDGYHYYIQFEDVKLWDSDNEERIHCEKTDTYEDLEAYVKKQFNNLVTNLNKIKFN